MQKLTLKNDPIDIIEDMMQRVAPLLAKPPGIETREKFLIALEKELRHIWGGDRVYIPHRRGAESGQLHSERNSRILRAHQQGRHIAYMAKAEGLSERRVLQIVGTLRKSNKARTGL